VQAEPFDLGRVWSLRQAPLEYFRESYGVDADEKGLRHLRDGTVRLPGCTGTLVSPDGLVLTAARCVRPFLSARMHGADYESFVAERQADEQSLAGLHVDRLVETETVTNHVEQKGREAVRERMQSAAGRDQHVEIVLEGQGDRYVAYTYHRSEDVRLAFYPDRDVTLAGRLGQPLSYPQHAWDVAVLRVYQDSVPLSTPNHLSIRRTGVRPGDPVFGTGYPAKTRRGETHKQLAFQRDLHLPVELSLAANWIKSIRRNMNISEAEGDWTDRLSDIRMKRNRLRAQLDGLQSDYVMDRLRARDRELLQNASVEESTDGKSIIDRLADIQKKKRSLGDAYRAFSFLLHPEYSSATLRRAVLVAQRRSGEVSSTDSLNMALNEIPKQPAAMDAALLTNHLDRLRRHLPADTALTNAIDNLSPAASLVNASIFSHPERLRARVGQNEVPEDDALLQLGSAIASRYADFQADWKPLKQMEARLTDSLAQVRQRAADQPVALPQHQAPRMTDGRVEGYSMNGTTAPSLTTFFGLYERHHGLPGGESELPDRWRSPGASFDRSTPVVTVASTDPVGTEHGGPLVNTALEVVGVVFDGNVQSAAGEYLFLPDRMRTVAVDIRGVIEGLSDVYDADHLVQEMTQEDASP